jgi:hypothetical protein
LLAAKLRRSNIDANAGAKEEIARIVGLIRARLPRVRILLRADSGFNREELMNWCEQHRVDFVFGLARNARLVDETKSMSNWRRPTRRPRRRASRRAPQGLSLFDARHLVAPAARGRQVGMDRRRCQPAVHRDLVRQGRDQWPLPLRAGLLRARRNGDPN